MASLNAYTYFEIDTGGKILRLGSLTEPSTVSLTGTGVVDHKVFNDYDSTTTPATLYSTTTSPASTGVVAILVKATQSGWISYGDLDADGSNADTSSVPITANVWTFIAGITFNQHGGKSAINRLGETASNIKELYYKRNGGGTADIEVVVVY